MDNQGLFFFNKGACSVKGLESVHCNKNEMKNSKSIAFLLQCTVNFKIYFANLILQSYRLIILSIICLEA